MGDVWICPYPMGHIQATGFDAAGRKQYRYHDLWRTRRDADKFESMVRFAEAELREAGAKAVYESPADLLARIDETPFGTHVGQRAVPG